MTEGIAQFIFRGAARNKNTIYYQLEHHLFKSRGWPQYEVYEKFIAENRIILSENTIEFGDPSVIGCAFGKEYKHHKPLSHLVLLVCTTTLTHPLKNSRSTRIHQHCVDLAIEEATGNARCTKKKGLSFPSTLLQHVWCGALLWLACHKELVRFYIKCGQCY